MSLDDRALAARGGKAGLSLNALSQFYPGARARKGLLPGFAAMPERGMACHVRALGRLLKPAFRIT